jgi:heme exporter protein B
MSGNMVRVVAGRDLRLAGRWRIDALLPLAFFVLAGSLFPLGVGPEPERLAPMAAGVVWVCALLANMLSLGTLYAVDHADGSLEQMLLSTNSTVLIVVGKTLAHWCLTGVPLIVVSPLLRLFFGMSPPAVAILALTLLLCTPVLSLLGGLGAALTLGLRRGGVLVLLLVLPLCIPVLIFGTGAVAAVDAAMSADGHLSVLTALLLLSGLGAPLATAAALRITMV